MTWLRWDVETPRSPHLLLMARALGVRRAEALGLYFACVCGFGEHQQGGNLDAVIDESLEDWAGWHGRRGRFAAAFRQFCRADGEGKDPIGTVRGFRRNRAWLAKQDRDRQKRSTDPIARKGTRTGSPEKPERYVRNERDERDERKEQLQQPASDLGGSVSVRLVQRLGGHPSRFDVLTLLDNLPDGRDPNSWAGTMLGCLDGLMIRGGLAASVDELAAACIEYPGIKNCGWAPAQFIATVERTVLRLRSKPPETLGAGPLPKGGHEAKIKAAMADFVEGGP